MEDFPILFLNGARAGHDGMYKTQLSSTQMACKNTHSVSVIHMHTDPRAHTNDPTMEVCSEVQKHCIPRLLCQQDRFLTFLFYLTLNFFVSFFLASFVVSIRLHPPSAFLPSLCHFPHSLSLSFSHPCTAIRMANPAAPGCPRSV